MSSDDPSKKLFSKRSIRARYDNISGRTVDRWIEKEVLPPPDLIINLRPYWHQTTIERHERQLIAEKAAKK